MLHLVKLMIWDEMPEDIFVFVCLEPDNEVFFLHAKGQNIGLKTKITKFRRIICAYASVFNHISDVIESI